ncbi:MAG: hypothetical protein M3O34_18245 [Chloroflexota bacterium]|nr:hypothetical protein [Chloroflexota bacterium]
MSAHAPDAPRAGLALGSDDATPPRRRRHRFPWKLLLTLVLGMLLGAALLATFQASGSLPPPPIGDPAAELDSDVIVSIRESYLNRVIAERPTDPAAGGSLQNLKVDLEPGRRLSFVGDVPVMNQRFQANVSCTLGVVDGRIRVTVETVRVGTLALPTGLGDMLAEPLNAELARLVADDQFRIVDVATATDRVIVRLAAADPSQSRQPTRNP